MNFLRKIILALIAVVVTAKRPKRCNYSCYLKAKIGHPFSKAFFFSGAVGSTAVGLPNPTPCSTAPYVWFTPIMTIKSSHLKEIDSFFCSTSTRKNPFPIISFISRPVDMIAFSTATIEAMVAMADWMMPGNMFTKPGPAKVARRAGWIFICPVERRWSYIARTYPVYRDRGVSDSEYKE